MNSTPTYLTVNQFVEKHPAFPAGGLRYRIFYAKQNGLEAAGAIVRNGRRILIREDRFFAWLESQNGKAIRGGAASPDRPAA